jgi:hypothetical protein
VNTPTPPPETTDSGRPERRRRDRRATQRRRDEQDRMPVTRGEFRRRGRNDRLLFLALALISCIAAFMGYKAGQDSQNGLAHSGARAAFDTCVAGAELRTAVATGLDDLRSLAITRRVPQKVRDRFVRQTQPAIDRLLTQAAYGTDRERRGRTFHAPVPPGSVTPDVTAQVRSLSLARCTARVGEAFGDTRTG